MPTDAELKLTKLVAQVERRLGGAGYATMAERHERLIVCDEIRRHCRAHGLDLPPGVPPDGDDT